MERREGREEGGAGVELVPTRENQRSVHDSIDPAGAFSFFFSFLSANFTGHKLTLCVCVRLPVSCGLH